jgi:CBS domain-containing protein
MHASQVMTTNVIATTVDTTVREVARQLLDHGISAMPVLSADGTPVGMVSEGDLVKRDDMARLEWLGCAHPSAPPAT